MCGGIRRYTAVYGAMCVRYTMVYGGIRVTCVCGIRWYTVVYGSHVGMAYDWYTMVYGAPLGMVYDWYTKVYGCCTSHVRLEGSLMKTVETIFENMSLN